MSWSGVWQKLIVYCDCIVVVITEGHDKIIFIENERSCLLRNAKNMFLAQIDLNEIKVEIHMKRGIFLFIYVLVGFSTKHKLISSVLENVKWCLSSNWMKNKLKHKLLHYTYDQTHQNHQKTPKLRLRNQNQKLNFILQCFLFYQSHYYENLVSVKQMLVSLCIPPIKDYSCELCSQQCYLLEQNLIMALCIGFPIDEILVSLLKDKRHNCFEKYLLKLDFEFNKR